ncbi:hypothetical protein WJX74_009566 [Apatococcus lobatus]|uniref:BTB domain-containing protein n=1 Tax=Apatococcus lobatus TaxID=904363 RepID=A0AAW1RB40_9CHLO
MTVVELSVGGAKFTTTRATLTREPESMLARMFDGGLPPCQKDSKGRYVIDRNGTAFGYVLDYLRGEPTRSPYTSQERSQLFADAEYYQLQGLQAQLAANGALCTPSSLPGPPQTEIWSHMTAMEAKSAAIMRSVASAADPQLYFAAKEFVLSGFWSVLQNLSSPGRLADWSATYRYFRLQIYNVEQDEKPISSSYAWRLFPDKWQTNWLQPKLPNELQQVFLDNAYTLQYDLDNMGYYLDVQRGQSGYHEGKIMRIALHFGSQCL